MGETRNSYKILVGKYLSLGRRWEDIIKMGLRKIVCDDPRWMGRVQWLTLVLANLNLRILPPACLLLDICPFLQLTN